MQNRCRQHKTLFILTEPVIPATQLFVCLGYHLSPHIGLEFPIIYKGCILQIKVNIFVQLLHQRALLHALIFSLSISLTIASSKLFENKISELHILLNTQIVIMDLRMRSYGSITDVFLKTNVVMAFLFQWLFLWTGGCLLLINSFCSILWRAKVGILLIM